MIVLLHRGLVNVGVMSLWHLLPYILTLWSSRFTPLGSVDLGQGGSGLVGVVVRIFCGLSFDSRVIVSLVFSGGGLAFGKCGSLTSWLLMTYIPTLWRSSITSLGSIDLGRRVLVSVGVVIRLFCCLGLDSRVIASLDFSRDGVASEKRVFLLCFCVWLVRFVARFGANIG